MKANNAKICVRKILYDLCFVIFIFSENDFLSSSQSTGSTLGSPPSTGFHSTASTGSQPVSPAVRRGPGRPRLKPTGPPNTGSRGTYRPRKPAKPLPVPLPSDGSNVNSSLCSSGAAPSYTTYLYDFPDQSDS